MMSHAHIFREINKEQSIGNAVKIDYPKIQRGQVIGEGTYAEVFYGEYHYDEMALPLAIKQSRLEKSNAVKYLTIEKNILSRLGANSYIACAYQCENLPVDAMVMEYLPNGDLFSQLLDQQQLTWGTRLKYSWEIAQALQHLDENNIIHRDIKVENILLDKDEKAKLCDFGFALQLEPDQEVIDEHTTAGTLCSIAPERLIEHQVGFASDIYSYGVLMYQLSTAQNFLPEICYYGVDHVIEQIGFNKRRPSLPVDCPRDYKKLIEACWDSDPDLRPSAGECVKRLNEIMHEIDEARECLHPDVEEKIEIREVKSSTDKVDTPPKSQSGLNQYSTFAKTSSIENCKPGSQSTCIADEDSKPVSTRCCVIL